MLRNNRHYPRGGQRAIGGAGSGGEGAGGGRFKQENDTIGCTLKKSLLYPETIHEASAFQ